MRVSRVSGVRSSDARSEWFAQGDDARGVDAKQHIRRVGGDVPGPVAIAPKLLRHSLGHERQIHLGGCDQPAGSCRWSPAVMNVTRREVDQLVQDAGEIGGNQLRPEKAHKVAGLDGPESSKGCERRVQRKSCRAATATHQLAQRSQRGRVGRVSGQLQERVDEDRTEQSRRGPGGLDHLPGGSLLLGRHRPGARIGPIHPIQVPHQVADYRALSSDGSTSPRLAVPVPPGSLVRQMLLFKLPLGFLLRLLGGNGRQVRQLPRAVAVRTPHAVLVVEVDCQLQNLVSLPAGWSGVLAANFH